MWNDLSAAVDERKTYSKGEAPEQKQAKFFKLLEQGIQGQGKKGNRSYIVSVGDMQVGHKFSIKGTEFEITHIDPDNGEVTVKDGTKFGIQQIPDGADVPVDKGSLEAPKEAELPEGFGELPPKPATPKLRPGEKIPELFQGGDQPFNLAGESGTDAERIAAAKEKAEKDKAEGAALAAKQQSQFVGLGGAALGEVEPSPQTATGIKNATVDAERTKRGLPPAMQPARRSFGEVWDQAMAILDRDPGFLDDQGDHKGLLSQLRDKPRALTDVEDALLLASSN